MNGAEHTFPLPEVEAHKLDEVKEALDHSQAPAGLSGVVRANPWLAVAVAGVWGLCLGLWLRSRE